MKIFDYEEVVMNWDSFTYPIAVGTPVSVDGVLADNSSAHGLIARTVFAKPDGGDTLKIMTGGFIDMEEIVAGYGQELSSAAVQALCGIHFYKDGVCIPTGGSGSGDDSQKWKTETSTQLFSETVTTVAGESGNDATLSYAEPITADTLKVTFNGVEYTCHNNATPEDILQGVNGLYGAPINPETGAIDWSEYPFAIYSYNSDGSVTNDIRTENVGTYTVSTVCSVITYTPTFVESVKANNKFAVNFSNYSEGIKSDKTASEILQAYNNGYLVIGKYVDSDNYVGDYYPQEVNKSTGNMSFVKCSIRMIDSAPVCYLKGILKETNSTDPYLFTYVDFSVN